MVSSIAGNNVSHSQLLIIDLHAKWIENLKNKIKKTHLLTHCSPSDSNVYFLNDIFVNVFIFKKYFSTEKITERVKLELNLTKLK